MDVIILQTSHDGYMAAMRAIAGIGYKTHTDFEMAEDTFEVLQHIVPNTRQLVISSQHIGEAEINGGERFSLIVKKRNPQSLFFIYSVYGAESPNIDGVLIKQPGQEDLVQLQQLVKRFKEGATLDELKAFLK